MSQPVAREDSTWLSMDRSQNLMHVNGLMGFDQLPEFSEFLELVEERMVHKYRVLSQVALERDGNWVWEDDPDFDLERHVQRVVLQSGSSEAVRSYISSQFSVPFDRAHPLWEIQFVSGPAETDSGGYLYGRFHHGLGDGIRLVQMLIGACDPVADAVPNVVGRRGAEHHHPLERMLHVVEHTVGDTADFVGQVGRTATSAARSVVSTVNPFGLAHHVSEGIDLVRHPVKLVDALSGLSKLENEVTNTWRELFRMLASDGHEAAAWSGQAGIEKSVAWVEGFPLEPIREFGKARGATVNDVLLAAVSLGLTDYLAERAVHEVEDVSWMMPVSLKPIDTSLPDRLGNHFAVVMLSLPLGVSDPETLVEEIHERTTRLKHSAEPAIAFGLQQVVAEAPDALAQRLIDFFAAKTVGQLSNVPGPRIELEMAGARVRSILGWVPTSGDQPLGICLFSYNGTVNVGVATDARMIPDPLHLAELIEDKLELLTDESNAFESHTNEGAQT